VNRLLSPVVILYNSMRDVVRRRALISLWLLLRMMVTALLWVLLVATIMLLSLILRMKHF